MLFKLKNPASGRVTHCGVLEFTAKEGTMHLPSWVCVFFSPPFLFVECYDFSSIVMIFFFFFPFLSQTLDDGKLALRRGRHCESKECEPTGWNIHAAAAPY